MDAVRRDLVADRDLWFEDDPIVFIGDDLTGSTRAMQVRQKPDLTGTPNANLAGVATAVEGIQLVYAGTDTLTNHRAADRISADDLAGLLETENPATGVNYVASDSVLLSIILVRISDTVMGAMPAAAKVGDDLEMAYDLLITLSGGKKKKRFYGAFTVRPTVTK